MTDAADSIRCGLDSQMNAPNHPVPAFLAPLPFVPLLVGRDGGHDDHAFYDVDVENVDPKEGEARGDDPKDQHQS